MVTLLRGSEDPVDCRAAISLPDTMSERVLIENMHIEVPNLKARYGFFGGFGH